MAKKPKNKRGPALLSAWLKKNGKADTEFSDLVDCSKQTVGGIKKGTFPPGLSLAFRIEKATNCAVPASSWVE